MAASAGTLGSDRYPGTFSPSGITPSPYCPRTAKFKTSSGVIGFMARKIFPFSLRTASASKEMGGSIAMSAMSWKRWFGTMSRSAPASS